MVIHCCVYTHLPKILAWLMCHLAPSREKSIEVPCVEPGMLVPEVGLIMVGSEKIRPKFGYTLAETPIMSSSSRQRRSLNSRALPTDHKVPTNGKLPGAKSISAWASDTIALRKSARSAVRMASLELSHSMARTTMAKYGLVSEMVARLISATGSVVSKTVPRGTISNVPLTVPSCIVKETI